MSQAIFDKFTADVKAKLAEAKTMFNLTIDVDKVQIRNDIRGKVGGYAGLKNGVYFLRFNREAILNYNEDMTKDTIPHEVAHIACFNQRHLGSDHDYGWKRVCRMLGGDDSRTHDMTLTAAKVVVSRRQPYLLPSGRTCNVGPKHHKMIQAGCTTIFMRNPKEFLRADQWVHYGKAAAPVQMAASQPRAIPGLNIVRSDIPALPQFGSKREKAEVIYKANKHLARGEVIKLFVAHAEMTPAGAATYYQNFRKAGI